MITIQKMLDLGVIEGAEVLAGGDYLQNRMVGITSFDSPDGYKWLRQGEFVLTTGYPFVVQNQDLCHGLLQLLTGLLEKGTPGLAIKLGRYITHLPEAVISFADSHRFPILSFPMHMAWSDAIVPIANYLNNLQRAEIDRTHAIYEQFHQYLAAGGGLDHLAKLLSQLLQIPISIYLMNGKTTVHYPKHQIQTEELDSVFTNESLLKGKQELKQYKSQNLIHQLYIDGVLKGGIILWNINRQLASWEKVAVEQAAGLISLKIERDQTVNTAYQRARNELIVSLVEGVADASEVLRRRAEEVGWRLQDDYFVGVMDYSSKQKEAVEWKEKNTLLAFFQANLPALFPKMLIGLDRENRFVLLLPKEHQDLLTKRNWDALVTQLEKTGKKPFFLGTSRGSYHVHHLNVGYNEASLSFKVAQRTNESSLIHPLIHVKCFADLSVERILLADDPREEAKQLGRECLDKLSAYDKEKNGQLVDTLKTFLDTNGNYREAAARLFIHKNTIKYRLQLIQELTGLNPEAGKDQFLFRLALSVRSLL